MIVQAPLEKVRPNPWQTRKAAAEDSEYIVELAADIEAHGLLQIPRGRAMRGKDVIELDGNPGVVLSSLQNEAELTVQLCFGHNRLQAYKRLFGIHGKVFDSIPVEVFVYSDEQMATLAWSENEKRREHTAMERAQAIQDRMTDFGWSQAEVADKLGISRPAVSNALRLFKLPEKAQKALSEGAISERMGIALLGLFDLPEELRDFAEQHYYMAQRPSWIVEKALKGAITSNEVREKIDDICREHGRKLEAADWSLDEEFSIPNVIVPACRDCDKRFKERNICLMPQCFEIKQEETHRSYLEKAGQVCGIQPLEEGKYGYGMTTSFSNFTNKDHLDAVKAAGCENLRLMFVSGKKSGEDPAQVEGFSKAFIVCVKREQYCTCLKGLKYAEASQGEAKASLPGDVMEDDESDEVGVDDGERVASLSIPEELPGSAGGKSAEELKELARAARREKREANEQAKVIVQEVGRRIAGGLEAGNLKTWNKVAHNINYALNGSSIREIQYAIGLHLAERDLPYEIKQIGEVVINMNRLLVKCGLEELGDRSVEASEQGATEEEEAKDPSLIVF